MHITHRLKVTAVAAVAAFCASTQAQSIEWRVLGPAWSHHFGTQAAVRDRSIEQRCSESSSETLFFDTNGQMIPGFVNGVGGVYAVPPYSIYCQGVIVEEKRNFTENNPSFGIEVTRRDDTHSDKLLMTLTRDSYDTPSVMLAVGRMWPVAKLGTVKFDAGVVGGLWYRSVLNWDRDGLDRRFVPFVLPALSLSESVTGLGLNVALAPRLKVRGRALNETTTLMLQTTLKVAESKQGSTQVGLGFDEQMGGWTATISKSF